MSLSQWRLTKKRRPSVAESPIHFNVSRPAREAPDSTASAASIGCQPQQSSGKVRECLEMRRFRLASTPRSSLGNSQGKSGNFSFLRFGG